MIEGKGVLKKFLSSTMRSSGLDDLSLDENHIDRINAIDVSLPEHNSF
jgi:hypothetical protein